MDTLVAEVAYGLLFCLFRFSIVIFFETIPIAFCDVFRHGGAEYVKLFVGDKRRYLVQFDKPSDDEEADHYVTFHGANGAF